MCHAYSHELAEFNSKEVLNLVCSKAFLWFINENGEELSEQVEMQPRRVQHLFTF